ncbi:unnamed protein product [Durusdinium trenchii]|uniref:Uncharacterized protein n=1 Tax=Durusdinium trenchii TaxID=1381693 RepID=A0ABP0NZH0_9DINO
MVEKCLKSADQAQEIIGQVEEMMLPAGFTSKAHGDTPVGPDVQVATAVARR